MPVQELHRNEVLAVLFADVENRADIRVIRCGCGLGFAAEAFQRSGVVEHLGLDRMAKPGERIAESQDISRLFDMSHTGKYVIQASRRISDEKDSDVVKSHKVTINVIQ